MVNKLVDIEGGVDIKNVHIIDLPIYWGIRWESRKQVRTSNDGAKMDDTHVACTSMSGFRSHHPVASGGILFITSWVPVDQCAWVVDAVVWKLEEEVNSCYKETLHSNILWVSDIDEDTISAWARNVALQPRRHGVDDLTIHPSRARWVAWCTEYCCGWVENWHLQIPYHLLSRWSLFHFHNLML